MDRLFIIVKGGSVEEVYSTKSSNELYAEVLDFDSTERTEEEDVYKRQEQPQNGR